METPKPYEFEGMTFPHDFDFSLAMALGESQDSEIIAVRSGYGDPVLVGTVGRTTGNHSALLVEKDDYGGDLVEDSGIVALYDGSGNLIWSIEGENPFNKTDAMTPEQMYDCAVFLREHRPGRYLMFLMRGSAENSIVIGRRTDWPEFDEETDEYGHSFAVNHERYYIGDILEIYNLDGDTLWHNPNLRSE